MRITFLLVGTSVAILNTARADDTALTYPETREVSQVDDFHGTKVADPYRWLEQDVREDSYVAEWVEAQNWRTALSRG